MLLCGWAQGQGWAAPQIVPYGPLNLEPSSLCLHYGLECFEGMKAFRGEDGKVRLFRPTLNAERLNRSCERLTLPTFETDGFMRCVTEAVRTDAAWIPSGRGYSLYIRPTVIATQASLGVGSSSSALFYIICCPTGPYFTSGFKPVSLLGESSYGN